MNSNELKWLYYSKPLTRYTLYWSLWSLWERWAA